MVAAAQIEPFHARQKLAEIPLHHLYRFNECIGVLLAEGMAVKAVEAGKVFALESLSQDSQTAARCTGVIDGVLLGGMIGIDAQAAAFPRCQRLVPETVPLVKAVKGKMISIGKQLVKPVLFIGGAEYVGFTAHMLAAQPRLVKTACR